MIYCVHGAAGGHPKLKNRLRLVRARPCLPVAGRGGCMTMTSVGNPVLRKGGSQTLRQTFLCLNAEGRFRHKHSSLICILPEWLVAEAPLRFKIQKF